MNDLYRITLMPRAADTFSALRARANCTVDRFSPRYFELRPFMRMYERVSDLLISLKDAGNAHMDQPLLVDGIQTRCIESTLVYFLRLNHERQIKVLLITEFDATASYSKFSSFMSAGGWQLLNHLGVNLPNRNIGSSASIQ
jgi:hypothetical protein